MSKEFYHFSDGKWGKFALISPLFNDVADLVHWDEKQKYMTKEVNSK